ncbi:MAG: DEAD/DEAH box helicase [Candidatus Marinimicrobia bacterium]|nr:DEAD/DEAH box helicase [Candidatus Neomarinimicrobiota bacterium]
MNESKNWKEFLKKEGFKPKQTSTVLLDNAISAFLHKHQQQFTEIQSQAIQPIYAGENALLISSTASGKTEAVVIPIAARISENRKDSLCIYIAPTRALLNDLYKRLSVPLHRLNIQLGIRHGDKPLSSSGQELSFLLTTPESLDILLCKGYPFLSKVKFVVCDEIHQVFGSPRGLQLLFLLERLRKRAGRELQRIALSATVGNQNTVSEWFRGGDKPIRIFSTGIQRPLDPEFHWLDRDNSLRNLIQRSKAKKFLIFVNSRRMCDNLFLELCNFSPYRVFVHYSTLEREQREYVESQFKASEYAICIATTTLELGIDIGSIEAIILYEPPPSVTSFLQRIGRGSRREEKTWVIMTPKNNLELLQFLSLTSLASEGIIENIPPGQFYSVLIQQIFSGIAAKHHHRVHQREIEEICNSFPWIRPEEITLIIQRLSNQRYLRYETRWSSYQIGPRLEPIYNEMKIFSNITNSESGIQVFHEGRRLASLPLPVARLRLGAVILFAGRYWEITSVGESQIIVRLTKSVPFPIRPSYGKGGGNYMSSIVAQKIKTVLLEKVNLSDFRLNRDAKNCLRDIQARIPSESFEGGIFQTSHTSKHFYYYTFAGSAENRTLQLLFSQLGHSCQLMRNAEGIGIYSNEPLNFSLIPYDQKKVKEIIYDHWQSFLRLINTGPFFNLLPISLKKKEVLSQIDYEGIVSNVVGMRNRTVIPISGRLF